MLIREGDEELFRVRRPFEILIIGFSQACIRDEHDFRGEQGIGIERFYDDTPIARSEECEEVALRRGKYLPDGFGPSDRNVRVFLSDEHDIPELRRATAFDERFFLPRSIPRCFDADEVFSWHLTVDVEGVIEDAERFHRNDVSIYLDADIFEGSDFQGKGSGMDEEASFGVESVSEGEEEDCRGRDEKEAGERPKKQPSARR